MTNDLAGKQQKVDIIRDIKGPIIVTGTVMPDGGMRYEAPAEARHRLTIVGSHESGVNRARDGMTLGELRDYDEENHKLILKESKLYKFQNMPSAAKAKLLFMKAGLKKLGVPLAQEEWNDADKLRAAWSTLEAQIKERNIVLEERPPGAYNVEQDRWQSGTYIYKDGDIVFFISNPFAMKARKGLIYLANKIQFALLSNCPREGW